MSDSNVMMFLATAVATGENPLGYRAGEKHAVVAFVRQTCGGDLTAFSELGKRGWSDISITESAPTPVAALESIHTDARAAYEDALNDGFAALVFGEPLT